MAVVAINSTTSSTDNTRWNWRCFAFFPNIWLQQLSSAKRLVQRLVMVPQQRQLLLISATRNPYIMFYMTRYSTFPTRKVQSSSLTTRKLHSTNFRWYFFLRKERVNFCAQLTQLPWTWRTCKQIKTWALNNHRLIMALYSQNPIQTEREDKNLGIKYATPSLFHSSNDINPFKKSQLHNTPTRGWSIKSLKP